MFVFDPAIIVGSFVAVLLFGGAWFAAFRAVKREDAVNCARSEPLPRRFVVIEGAGVTDLCPVHGGHARAHAA